MPRFHFRRGAPAGTAEVVLAAAVAAGGCSFRQGVMLTMAVAQRMDGQVEEGQTRPSSSHGWLTLNRTAGFLSRGRCCIRARPTYPCTRQTQGTDDKRWALHVHSGCGGVSIGRAHEGRWKCTRCGRGWSNVVHIAAISRYCTLTYPVHHVHGPFNHLLPVVAWLHQLAASAFH
jgi:hypothetical protein